MIELGQWTKIRGHLKVWFSSSASIPHLCDQLAPGLGALPVDGTFAFLGEDSLSCGAVLEGKLTDDLTELSHFNVPHRVWGLTQVQQEGMKPAKLRKYKYVT